jgi:transmembrane sensor
VPATLAAAAMALIGFGVWRFVDLSPADTAGPFAIATTTEIGVLRKIPLPDGSVIQLNTDSAVDVRFTTQERRVALTRGEAHFTVAKNRERPFIVSVGGVDVRVVGTVFNIRLRNESVDVLVTEGTVRVGATDLTAPGSDVVPDAPGHSEVTAGQKLSIERQAPAVPHATREELSAMEVKQALAWQSRRLDFDATPLEEIVAEMNRYNRHKLVIADSRLTARRFGGSFPAGDYETIVRMLEANFGVVAENKDGETLLRLKAPAP